MILIFFRTFQEKISNSPKFKDFPGHSRTKFKFQDIPGFSRTVGTMYVVAIMYLLLYNLDVSLINSFVLTAPFLYPLKTSRNREVFCFQGAEKGCTGDKWVNLLKSASYYKKQNFKAILKQSGKT